METKDGEVKCRACDGGFTLDPSGGNSADDIDGVLPDVAGGGKKDIREVGTRRTPKPGEEGELLLSAATAEPCNVDRSTRGVVFTFIS